MRLSFFFNNLFFLVKQANSKKTIFLADSAVQLFLLNELISHSRITQLEHMSDKTIYTLTLDFFHLINRSIVNRGVALDSTCMLGATFERILVRVRLFSEQTELTSIKC